MVDVVYCEERINFMKIHCMVDVFHVVFHVFSLLKSRLERILLETQEFPRNLLTCHRLRKENR